MSPRSSLTDRESCVLGAVLERQARTRPDADFVLFEEAGDAGGAMGAVRWSYADTWRLARRSAAGLQALGVGFGEPVLSWLPNGPWALRTWFGANLLGSVYTPVNTAYRGALLERVLRNSEARVLVAHPSLLERLRQVDTAELRTVVVVGGPAGEARTAAGLPAGIEVLDVDVLDRDDDDWPGPARSPEPWDTQSIMYTSGTTGPSKGVLISYRQHHAAARAVDGMDETDRDLVNTPLFHSAATLPIANMLAVGGSVAVVPGFRTQDFWSTVERTGVTQCNLLGAMTSFLVADEGADFRPERHRLRGICVNPFTADAVAFGRRFGVRVWTAYNSTELSTPILTGADRPSTPGTCGRARAGFDLRLVDDVDQEVADGEPGELIIRADEPWTISTGYHRMPAATAAAWRNGWFHTGDAFRRTPDGEYVFVDRLKDVIRRRGENVSSMEVEAEAVTHPAVAGAAAVGVAGEHAEQEILLVVQAAPGREVDHRAPVEHLAGRLPYFMVPRYLRTVDELPLTPTGKVRKDVLRAEAVTADTWDRESAGLVFRRERLT
ncbi:Hydroxyl acids CoA ligase [Frankia canadensis]|uniref:Hydroxyl acids CoA ligase n=1 Tax=Frankia canadensis TaxID=1836972 RepID=A0A2I2KLN6_9ACTN|nr:AMP-binding protein [Frankia canadensis]SNQ46578.1 Hydroxyl acids CoA ligase [Frankia canadensis]SOU53868.1 Hydroxyl acids CoA ligase [Frankia canadensis]